MSSWSNHPLTLIAIVLKKKYIIGLRNVAYICGF